MNLTQIFPLLITLVVSLFGSWLTIRVTIAELKKDITHLQEKLELITATRNEHDKQNKDDMKELMDDMKKIIESVNEMKVGMARMEARNEGKDEVIGQLKDAVTTILKDKK
jgi:seryl-tRNA synthetase